ncbi:MAG: hypothetical protein ACN2B6_02740 [Rickettsiales bacterium]
MSMDTEKYITLEHKVSHGKSPNDEGPYYHHAFWESYKGGIKGKLFGVIVGGMIGTFIGGAVLALAVAAPQLGLAALVTQTTALATMAIFAGAGITYGMKEFGQVGRITGGSAAQFYQHELREKTFVKGQVAELKEDIDELKALVKGEQPTKNPEYEKSIALAAKEEQDYRKTHYAKLTPNKLNSIAFWKVLALGLAVGAAAGAILAVGGTASVAAEILIHMGVAETAVHALGSSGIMAASVVTMGALGASFGINRDSFRKIADKTDLLFKGRLSKKDHNMVLEDQIEAGEAILEDLKDKGKKVVAEATGIEYPESETHFRDKVMPAAQRALLSFDHTRATPQ